MNEKNINNKVEKQKTIAIDTQPNEKEKVNDTQTKEISGGYTGLFQRWGLIKTYCDFCNEKIDGVNRSIVPILGNKHMCNKCFENQKKILGEDAANEKWLGFDKNMKRSESKVDITHKNIYKQI